MTLSEEIWQTHRFLFGHLSRTSNATSESGSYIIKFTRDFPILIKFYRQRDTFILELPLAFPGPEICPWFVNIPSSLAIFLYYFSLSPPPPPPSAISYSPLSSPLTKNVLGLFHLEVKSTNVWKKKCGLIGGERWSRFCLVLARVR